MDYRIVSALLFAALLGAPQAYADPPDRGGKGKHHNEHRGDNDQRRDERGGHGHSRHFSERDYVVVHEYYHEEYRRGKCPPGLAKKHNGCMPPGQARKWGVGERLPREVIYYEVPRAVVVNLPRPNPGYRYVRVASDILLISVGTGMIVDAVRNLGGM